MTTAGPTLTALDIRALRQADETIVFRYYADRPAHERGVLEAYKKPDAGDPWQQSRCYAITCTAGATSYEYMQNTPDTDANVGAPVANPDPTSPLREVYGACHPVYRYKHTRDADPLGTAISLMRVGDALELSWLAGNDHGYTLGAGLATDQLTLIIRRGKRTLEFLIAIVAAPKFMDSVRMCKTRAREATEYRIA